jgi:hypothetical protein
MPEKNHHFLPIQRFTFGIYFFMEKKTNRLNAEWHKKNKMPKNPTLQQRIDWHIEHQKNCACRPGLPEKLKAELKKQKIKITTGL